MPRPQLKSDKAPESDQADTEHQQGHQHQTDPVISMFKVKKL
jgi:hypothetical protein